MRLHYTIVVHFDSLLRVCFLIPAGKRHEEKGKEAELKTTQPPQPSDHMGGMCHTANTQCTCMALHVCVPITLLQVIRVGRQQSSQHNHLSECLHSYYLSSTNTCYHVSF